MIVFYSLYYEYSIAKIILKVDTEFERPQESPYGKVHLNGSIDKKNKGY
ncbi:hypothetical protein ACIGC1_15785 [Peribacillus butanolivorans]